MAATMQVLAFKRIYLVVFSTHRFLEATVRSASGVAPTQQWHVKSFSLLDVCIVVNSDKSK